MQPTMTYRGFTLDQYQIRAITQIEQGHSLVLAAPTGSGKTLVAEYLIDRVLQGGQRIVYTSPIKALSNQKYRDFSALYGDKVGILTGDVVINRDAQALIMTTEVFRNMVVEDPDAVADVAYVVFDEIHYLGDIERGTVWEESIIFSPPHVKFLALSATIPNAQELANWMSSASGHHVKVIAHNERAVPLAHLFFIDKALVPFKELLRRAKRARASGADRSGGRFARGGRRGSPEEGDERYREIIRNLRSQDRLPMLYFVFSRALADSLAQRAARAFDFTSPAEKERIAAMIDDTMERYNLHGLDTAQKMRQELLRGVGRHHAGLLPQLKELVEVLFADRILRVLFVTETFAVGVNMPARTVAFDTLKKFDGRSFRAMTSLEFAQISGRAGRRGIDKKGWVAIPYLPHDLDIEELQSLVYGDIEELRSQFDLSFNSVLNLYAGHKTEEIRLILKRNFAQFQANKFLPKLAKKVARFEEELEAALPRCPEKKNDLEEFMKFHKYKKDTVQSLQKTIDGTQRGLRGRRNRAERGQVGEQFSELFAQLAAKEKQFICGKCSNKGKCTARYEQSARIRKRLEFWRQQLGDQQELQLPLYEKKLKILRDLGYIDDAGLLPRGEFAAKIHVEEIAVTELYFAGFFHELDSHELNALAISLVYEHRRRGSEMQRQPSLRLLPKLQDARRAVRDLNRKYPFVRVLDVHLAESMRLWSTGVEFEELMKTVDIPEGDLIRAWRQAIDLLRQIREAVADHSLRDKLSLCLEQINRDIVLATELRD